MSNWIETYRGTVPPWECDVTEHFTIAYYFERLEEAEPNLADALGLGERLRGGGFARRLDVRFARELRAGSSFQIESAPLAVDDGLRLGHRFVDSANGETVTWIAEHWDLAAAPLAVDDGLRLGHRFVDSANGETVTWIAEHWDLAAAPLSTEQRSAIGGRLAVWERPAVEPRPEPKSNAGFIPTARGRVKPFDLDAAGRFGLAAMVHRFTTGCIQAGSAIGMDAEFMEKDRRGFSTFELGLRITGALGLDDPYLVETGIAHLGNSSLRLVHVMSDPRSGTEIARLGQYGVNLDLDARRPAKFPDEIRARATRLVIETA